MEQPRQTRKELKDFLVLDPPFELDKAPEAYALSRRRELTDRQLSWAYVLGEKESPNAPDPPPSAELEFDASFLKRYLLLKFGDGPWSGESDDATLPRKLYEAKKVRPLFPWRWDAYVGEIPTSAIGEAVVACLPVLEKSTFRSAAMAGLDPATDEGKKLIERDAILLPLRNRDRPDWKAGDPGAEELVQSNYVPEPLLTGNYPDQFSEEWAQQQPFVFCLEFDNGRHWRYYRPYRVVNASTSTTAPLTLSEFLAGGFGNIHGVELLFGRHATSDRSPPGGFLIDWITAAAEAASEGFSAVDNYRADAAYIMRQWAYLEAHGDVATRMARQADRVIGKLPDGTWSDGSTLPTDPAAWRVLAEQYMALKQPKLDHSPKEAMLADAAADLGYRLFLDDATVSVPREGTSSINFKVHRGELYQEQVRTTAWTTWHTVRIRRRSLFRSFRANFRVPHAHSKTYTFFKRVSKPGLITIDGNTAYEPGIDYDPWVEGARAYEKTGYRVFLLQELADGSLETNDGTTLVEIMEQCDSSEAFRRRCVVAIPFYELSISGDRLLAGYRFCVRPVKGLAISGEPAIALNEQLTYRFTWCGAALGELAASIPLAPGEEQEITISRQELSETSRSSTTRTLVELSSMDRRDFESTFEREVTTETQKTKRSSANASVPVKGGTISGGLSSETSTRTVARTLNRAVQRAAQELTRKSRQETEITVNEKVSVTATNAVTHRIRNVNQGSTLNLNMYRLMNHFQSGLFLEDFSFSVSAGPALIEGTEYRETRTFSRYSELQQMLAFVQANVPDPVSDTNQFRCRLLQELLRAVASEYSADDAGVPSAASQSDEVLRLDCPAVGDCADPQAIDRLMDALRNAQCLGSGPLAEKATFAYDSGALYIDATRGSGIATDQYAERMRALEEQSRSADIALVRARASVIASEASGDMDSNAAYVTGGRYSRFDNKLQLTFVPAIRAAETWGIYVLGQIEPYQSHIVSEAGLVTFEFGDNRPDGLYEWTHADYHSGLYLRNERTGERLAYRYAK